MEIITRVIDRTDHRDGVSKSGNEWSRDTFLFSDEREYPQRFVADVWKKDTAAWLYSHAGMGEDISVRLSFDAREYNGKWYNSIRVLMVTLDGRDVVTLNKEEENGSALPPTGAPAPEQEQQEGDSQSELPF